jgi:hypothetical protein
MNREPKELLKTRLVQDIVSIFSLNDLFSEKIKHHTSFHATYKWTEINGKHEGTQYWSFAAAKEYLYHDDRPFKLIHEHVVPREIILKTLKDKSFKKDFATIYTFFTTYLIAAIITKKEDENLLTEYKQRIWLNPENLKPQEEITKNQYKDLPPNNLRKQIWDRYIETNKNTEIDPIHILEITWENQNYISKIVSHQDLKTKIKEEDLFKLKERLLLKHPKDKFDIIDSVKKNHTLEIIINKKR